MVMGMSLNLMHAFAKGMPIYLINSNLVIAVIFLFTLNTLNSTFTISEIQPHGINETEYTNVSKLFKIA